MRFAAGFLFGVFLAGALLPLGVLLGATLIGLGLGTIWARRRATTRRRRCPDCGHEPVKCLAIAPGAPLPIDVDRIQITEPGFCPVCRWVNGRHAPECPRGTPTGDLRR